MGEIHILAYCYHWGRNECLDIPIRERSEWCNVILKQKQAESEALNTGSTSGKEYTEGF